MKEIETLKGNLKELEEVNRNMKLEIEEVRYKTDNNQEEKNKELHEKLTFFQSQKDASEKEKNELKKTIKNLEEELNEGLEREEVLETLTIKVDEL